MIRKPAVDYLINNILLQRAKLVLQQILKSETFFGAWSVLQLRDVFFSFENEEKYSFEVMRLNPVRTF